MTSPRFKVTDVLTKLSAEQREDFMSLCRMRPPAATIQRHLKDLTGDSVSVASIMRWFNNTFPTGKEAELFRIAAQEFQGMDTALAKEWLMGKTAKLVMELHAKLDEGLLEEAAPEQLIALTANLTRELKSITESIGKDRYIKDRSELELAGAHRLADILEMTFKDTQLQATIQSAIKGALEQIETEILGN
jgi:hypothetical protein